MKPQSILRMWTKTAELRDEVYSWDGESGDLINPDKEIGLSSNMRVKLYKTPCHALADNWWLMAPPVLMPDGDYCWWFEKPVF